MQNPIYSYVQSDYTIKILKEEKNIIPFAPREYELYNLYGKLLNKTTLYFSYHLTDSFNFSRIKDCNILSNNIKELELMYNPPSPPREGAFVGYKAILADPYKNEYALCTLLIPSIAERTKYDNCIINRSYYESFSLSEYRTNIAKVLSIKSILNCTDYQGGFSIYDKNFLYFKNDYVTSPIDYINKSCGSGIHFFMTPQEAIIYALTLIG